MLKKYFLLLLIPISISAQHSIGFNYSGKILGINYKDASFFSLEYIPNLINKSIKIGITATGVYSTISKDFITPNTPINVDDRSYSLGAFIRYFPIRKNLPAIPFGEIELGYYFGELMISSKGWIEGSGFLDLSRSYYIKVGGGALFFPESRGHIIVGIDYLLYSPKVKYRKTNYYPIGYTEFNDTANLSLLQWKAGLQFDF